MSHDIVSDALNMIMNIKKAGKKEVEIKRYSKLLLKVLDIAKKAKYLDYKLDEKNKILHIKILELTKCHSIKPRFHFKTDELEKYIRRYLPARNFGMLIVSTSKGLMTHEEVGKANLGGSLIACFY